MVFGSYSLPRLSLNDHDQEREPPAPTQRAPLIGDDRGEAQAADNSVSVLNARRKGKVKFKQKI